MFEIRKAQYGLLAVITSTICVTGAYAESPAEPGRDSGKANPLKNVYFGEEHLHT